MWEKLSIPGAIIVGSAFLALSFYLVQIDKRKSIENQQSLDNQRAEVEFEQSVLKLKQEECESLTPGLRDRWYNVIGVTYDNEYWEECIVTYTNTETGEVETSPLRFMKDN